MTTTQLLQQEELHPGYQLETYTLLERLGYGGQGAVWSAWDQARERVVAVKVVLADDPMEDTGAFQREADIVAGLTHPNILPLHDFGSVSNFRYTSTRYICSGSLADLLSSGPIPPEVVLPLAAQIAAALEYIHERNIVHRDLKPSNILLDTRRRAYLTDFGLARAISRTTEALHTGHGTAPYAPPEQLTKARLVQASDIFSFGILLFEMLTGKLPWDGMTSLAIRQLDKGEDLPDPRGVNPHFPATLTAALRSMTAASPSARPPSASIAYALVAGAFEEDTRRKATIDLGKPALEGALGVLPEHKKAEELEAEDAQYLVQQRLARWEPDAESFPLRLTDFYLADSVYAQPERYGLALDDSQHQFMLRGALAYGRHVAYWWEKVDDPPARARVCEQTIANEETAAAGRAVEGILGDEALLARPDLFSSSTLGYLLDLAIEAVSLHEKALELMNRLAPKATRWDATEIASPADMKMADLALTDGPQARHTARLIGHLRSEAAVQVLLGTSEERDDDRILTALMEVRDVAGSLPRSIPMPLRMRVVARMVRRQLFSDWVTLIRGYLVAALGSALGLGLHIYATYRVPQFLDAARILNAVGGGLLFGLLIGLGIFLTRLIVQRLEILAPVPRVVLGVAVGALIVNLGLASYHTLFLAAPPEGWGVATGSFLTALGFGLGTWLLRSRPLRMLTSTACVGLSISLSWLVALRMPLTPMLPYEVGRPVQTAVLMAATSLLIGALPHAGDRT